jgi:S-adenosylmethionine-diacylglycerol 3-amino-3-carboxypropyl transferase
VVATLRERVRRLACDFPIQDNYFGWQAFGRRYDVVNRQALPDYLRPEFYALLKEEVGRVATELCTVTGWLARQPAGAIDRVVLLDSQDWMTPQAINELWREIARVGRPGTRVIFRTAGSTSPLETALAPQVAARFSYHADQSRAIHARDRSAIYGAFHLYTLKD